MARRREGMRRMSFVDDRWPTRSVSVRTSSCSCSLTRPCSITPVDQLNDRPVSIRINLGHDLGREVVLSQLFGEALGRAVTSRHQNSPPPGTYGTTNGGQGALDVAPVLLSWTQTRRVGVLVERPEWPHLPPAQRTDVATSRTSSSSR